ncbi:hypothetical protein BCR41DRAFT_314861 [Lobosporangium transversale]|uniref:DUF6589 domain-containing protein n=1 Tax=Lobosporangium transversale TaxID=64571 RepID=A0A1Y2G5Z6_9FUNG|nr:hypothetical protein BCR41DRAFT_314861 [Lobosporangium transversale]ORY96102.1 hypothetical protein BCR41DRAFT_314861 [Lobosporangium transversale]|eukprot:XP_021875521.1 hypothetical protein BCR41DRAFT_314861 [Lobosporangium transversale]
MGFASNNLRASREERIIVPFIASMLMLQKNQQANQLQTFLGFFFRGSGCSKRAVRMLSSACLSVSYDSTSDTLQRLTKVALENVCKQVLEKPWMLVYDNINFANRKENQRKDNRDTFESGTTATIIMDEHLGDIPSRIYNQTRPQIWEFLPANHHKKGMHRFHISDDLQRYSDEYAQHAVQMRKMDVLKATKSIAIPLPTMKIDQSSTAGNIEVIGTVFMRMLKLQKPWFEGRSVIIGGDLLTVARVVSAQQWRITDVTRFDRLEWAIPVMQLFHLQMNLAATIFKTHYGSSSTGGSKRMVQRIMGMSF